MKISIMNKLVQQININIGDKYTELGYTAYDSKDKDITNKVEIPQIKMLFTTDLRQNEETLSNTLVEFKLVDGKYKMENVELKLIG